MRVEGREPIILFDKLGLVIAEVVQQQKWVNVRVAKSPLNNPLIA